MEHSNFIYQKLEAFIRKFYTNELIRGIVLFIGLGLLYFLFTLFVEYFLWLKPLGRTVLFWSFVGVEAYLFLRFILFPICKLFKLQKGIDYNQASHIIGNHFPEVSDKLTNYLQLTNSELVHNSELLMASIEQKAITLQPIPFGNAINYKENSRYFPFAIVPVLLFLMFYLSGNNAIISQSFNRVVHFNTAFIPPAPFEFVVMNSNLLSEQNKDFVLKIKTVGKVVPENAMIFIGNESYFLESVAPGEFQFKISKPSENVFFHLEANAVSSKEYVLKVVAVPSILNFEMHLNFPSYLNRKGEVVKGSGNAVIPEGTNVTWKILTEATQKIGWINEQTQFSFSKMENSFVLTKNIANSTEYQIFTSKNKVEKHEKLNYRLTVAKDQYPSINVSKAPDSLKLGSNYVVGQIADDYGVSKLQVVYYESNKPEHAKRGTIAIKKTVFDQFVFAFPSNLDVVQGISYDYYFEVFDNDALHRFKSTRSAVFSNRVSTDEENEDQVLKQQNDNISGLEKSLKNQNKQFFDIDKIQRAGKEKEQFEFKDQQKVNDFVQRQKQQDERMKEFSKKIKENLDQFKVEEKDIMKDELDKRLDNANKDLEKNKKLLDELQELNDKIQNEDLLNKLDKFKQNSKNQTKNLEQLVELTKKYYIEKKAEQLSNKLEKLSSKQEKISDIDKENTIDSQKEVKSDFDKILQELDDLSKENKELKSPLDLSKDGELEKNIEEDVKKAVEELQKNNKAKAKPKQKNAAKNMKVLAKKMTEGLEQNEQEQMEEDVKMLRQILDNLLAFSLSQEDVMVQFKSLKTGSPAFNKYIKQQQNLKQQFKHIDDSLFAMSLRNPKITEEITKEIGNVQYNVDKSLESLSDSQVPKGVSHQQYTVTAANKLGDFLSEQLNNMQMSLSGMGKGKPKPGSGSGMQLPDIIRKQTALGDKIKDGIQKGEKPREGSKSGKNSNQDGNDGEGDAQAIMEIYKEQQRLRESLEKELNKQGLGSGGQSTLEKMKQLEKQLLNKGFNNATMQKVLDIKQDLLKLETAFKEQGEDYKRESETNKNNFSNGSKALPESLLEYLNSIEILNRQSLPLRSNFNLKVQEYFNKK